MKSTIPSAGTRRLKRVIWLKLGGLHCVPGSKRIYLICKEVGQVTWSFSINGFRKLTLQYNLLLCITNGVSDIKAQAEKNYSSLPRQFQFRNNLRDSTLSTFERDFIGSVQLNHLHTLFLLNLLLLSTPTEPDPTLVDIAEQILSVTVDMVLLRDQLTNSGTCLLWKVCVKLRAHFVLLMSSGPEGNCNR